MIVSFCIPTLNRPDFLIRAIESICVDENLSQYFEICIYNNNSDASYSNVEKVIDHFLGKYNIIYKVGDTRKNIDLSMFEAIKLAQGDYLFFLGDDDNLTETGLHDIFDLIKSENFDMAVLNATLVNYTKNTRVQAIGIADKVFNDLEPVLVNLKKYCSYGNLLIKSKHINFDDFNYLVGTSHAYGCFWLSFFREYENEISPIVIIPKQSIVDLTLVEKNYNLLEVFFKHVDIEHQLYYNVIGPRSKSLLQKYETNFWKEQTSLIQLMRFEISGNKLDNIKIYKQALYNKIHLKILISKFLAKVLLKFKTPVKYILEILPGNNISSQKNSK